MKCLKAQVAQSTDEIIFTVLSNV